MYSRIVVTYVIHVSTESREFSRLKNAEIELIVPCKRCLRKSINKKPKFSKEISNFLRLILILQTVFET